MEQQIPAGKLYIVLISVHGLIRSHDLELGRDADTGGQVKYVVEFARALVRHPDVGRVDLLTRQVFDQKVSDDYARPEEELAPGAHLIRLPCGPRRYFRKEVLWPYLDSFVDQALLHIRRVGGVPDVVHGHYADAGYVGSRLAGLLGVPFFFTGHSLGRVKKRYLLENGMKASKIESRFRISQRIEAEEEALATARRIIVSTQHEVEHQYVLYDQYQPERKRIIPPGTDLNHFYPPRPDAPLPRIQDELARFLPHMDRPMILAISRPDERKNLHTLIEAYAGHPTLRNRANLVIIAGNRDDVKTMDPPQRRVLMNLFLQIDRHDLYGHVAFPKHHEPEDIPDLYRLAALSKGVFVLPTFFELFGLTLIEATASGLPVVATKHGGPKEIVAYCENGLLIDPEDAEAMGRAVEEALSDPERWRRWSEQGVERVYRRFTWKSHVNSYIETVHEVVHASDGAAARGTAKSKMPRIDRLLISDIDNTLLGDPEALKELLEQMRGAGRYSGFGIATGRTLESTLEVFDQWKVPLPDVLITSVGSEIYYGPDAPKQDRNWRKHIGYRWSREAVQESLAALPGLRLQPELAQRPHKVSFFVDEEEAPSLRQIKAHLRQHDLSANVIYSHGEFLDVLPLRASKGRALRYVAMRWGIPVERILVAGDSGNDEEMLVGDTLAVVVGNYSPELKHLRGNPHVYFAEAQYAKGILEGLDHYDFLGQIHRPDDEAVVA